MKDIFFSIQNRFKQFPMYEKLFGFLFSLEKLINLSNDALKESCLVLENSLKHDMYYDIKCLDMLSELKVFKKFYKQKLVLHLKY